jgi:hypothetical protein
MFRALLEGTSLDTAEQEYVYHTPRVTQQRWRLLAKGCDDRVNRDSGNSILIYGNRTG